MSADDRHDADNSLHDSQRPHSIDLSLELERQLETEDLPPSSPTSNNRPQSLDPHVLASIITQLRHSVAAVSKERDDLAALVSGALSREADLKDALQLTTDKCTSLEQELEVANAKIKDDEDAINMLRTKVEESRRGLMRLQTENRRISQSSMTLDLSRAGVPSFGGPASGKRASFTPLTGSGAARIHAHRRISSVSDSGFAHLESNDRELSSSPPPAAQIFTFPTNASAPPTSSGNHPPSSTRRFSNIFGRISPPDALDIQVQDPASSEIEALRRELNSTKAELEETRHELTETNEAREASESCVKALREFIGENSIGEQSISSDTMSVKLPPLPSQALRSDTEIKRTSGYGSNWGFNKLWRAESAGSSTSTSTPFVPSPPAAAPLSRKIGGFFSSRGSISSTTSSTSRAHVPASHGQEPMYNGNGSDTSSIEESVEPISPASEKVPADILVRDNRGSSASDLGGASPEQQMKALRGPPAVESVLPLPS